MNSAKSLNHKTDPYYNNKIATRITSNGDGKLAKEKTKYYGKLNDKLKGG